MLNELIDYIHQNDRINNKDALASLVAYRFGCVKDRSVYYTNDFAIRFCKAESAIFSNVVLSLSALQKYDHLPFIVCVVTPHGNHLLLANTTLLNKISHSSKELRIDNIRGSFLGSNIDRKFDTIENIPQNFAALFGIHQNFTFEENLSRLVYATSGIIPTSKRFEVSDSNMRANVINAPDRAIAFSKSDDYSDLLRDLDGRTTKYENEILVAALIENTKLRGEIIEYIIAGDDEVLRHRVIDALQNKKSLPTVANAHFLGDYTKRYPNYYTETDIKTKIMVLASAPKGYNLDKMLEFLSEYNTVFMIYLVGIDYAKRSIKTKLISMFQHTLIENTVMQDHWAGRNRRGSAQFNGDAIKQIILHEDNTIIKEKAVAFLQRLLSM